MYICTDYHSFCLLFLATLTIAPRIGNVLGGTVVRVSGPCLEETDLINCTFGGIVTPGLYISNMEALCVSPQLAIPGAVAFQLTVVREEQVEFEGEERFYACTCTCMYEKHITLLCWPAAELSEVHMMQS